ncbi:MAG TPA: SDR family oxidoreductase, partial [Albitalea sp.]|nr:SDR family oxidoreductase [Albitalea sp.]
QPIHVYELAEVIARLVEASVPLRAVLELGGPATLSYREMLAHYRSAQGFGAALWLPLPMPLMRLMAWAAEALPQKVFCRDTIRLLERGSVPAPNAAAASLGRTPTALAQGLAVTPPEPLVDLRVRISPALGLAMRASLAVMWLATAIISLCWPQESGVLRLLARCGFEGSTGVAVMLASCALNLTMGTLMLLRPLPWVYALQCAAVVGYTLTAAVNMPELTIDHCGPLLKNLPVLAMLLLLWSAQTMLPAAAPAANRRLVAARMPR